MDKKVQNRTDILKGELAEVFTFMTCNLNDTVPFLFDGIKCGLIKSKENENYYVAKSMAKWAPFENNPTYDIDIIRTEPIDMSGVDLKDAVRQQKTGFDLDIVIDGKLRTIYFNDELYPFKSTEERDAFEKFAYDVLDKNSKFETLSQLAGCFSDENFMIMTKDRINNYINEFCSGGFFAKKILFRNVNKAIEPYIKQNTMGE